MSGTFNKFGRGAMPPSQQVNPRQPTVMGFPDRPLAPGATPPVSPMGSRGNSPRNFPMGPRSGFANRPPSAPPLPGNRVAPPPTRPGISVGVPGTDTYKSTPMSPGAGDAIRSPNPFTVDAMPIGSTPAFKKGGLVKPKAPVKKAVGGPIKAKTAAKPAAKMAKPMPAMKRGGKVMAKGRKK